MAELRNCADHLQQENDRLWARLEEDWSENARGSSHPINKIKARSPSWEIVMQQRTTSYPLVALRFLICPPQRVEVESRKRPSRHSSRSVSGMHRRVRREISRERQQSEHALENVPIWHKGVAPSLPFMYPTFRAAPAPHMPTSTIVRGLEDMLSFPLGQHILSYEPPHGFVIPTFSMYDGSSDPYDHMLHFNQAMIFNAGEDCLLCKVFPASLKGPTLAWFHKLPQRSINSFSKLWAAFVSQYLCSVR